MRIHELVYNPNFSFDPSFRVARLVVGAAPELDKYITLYDSTVSPDLPFDLAFAEIVEIRVGTDGILEIDID